MSKRTITRAYVKAGKAMADAEKLGHLVLLPRASHLREAVVPGDDIPCRTTEGRAGTASLTKAASDMLDLTMGPPTSREIWMSEKDGISTVWVTDSGRTALLCVLPSENAVLSEPPSTHRQWFDPSPGKAKEVRLEYGRCKVGRLKDMMFIGTEIREPLSGEDIGFGIHYGLPGDLFDDSCLIAWSTSLSCWFSFPEGRDPERKASLQEALPPDMSSSDKLTLEELQRRLVMVED